MPRKMQDSVCSICVVRECARAGAGVCALATQKNRKGGHAQVVLRCEPRRGRRRERPSASSCVVDLVPQFHHKILVTCVASL